MAMTLAIRATGKLNRTAEMEDTLLRVAKRPAAITALKIEERFRFVVSVFGRHDLARTCGPTAVTWGGRRELDDIPAEGVSGLTP
jgi:hypothetical protein